MQYVNNKLSVGNTKALQVLYLGGGFQYRMIHHQLWSTMSHKQANSWAQLKMWKRTKHLKWNVCGAMMA